MQKDRWEDEYSHLKNIPSTSALRSSRMVKKHIESHPQLGGRALDMGSGNGRNSIYLAKNGYSVDAIELSSNAVDEANNKIRAEGLSDSVKTIQGNVGEKLPYGDDSFDLIIDMMTFHLLSRSEREIYISELQRILKRGGYYLIRTLASDSPAIKKLVNDSPGPEENSYTIPQSGMVEKAFTEQELLSLFRPLELVESRHIEEVTPAFGSSYNVNYYDVVFRRTA